MATEIFNSSRLILTMEGSTAIYRDDVAAAIAGLDCISTQEAEDLVATAGEDERGYGLRRRADFLDVLMRRIDEFLSDDDGGYYRMIAHLTHYDRSPAALEIWFQVARPGYEGGGTWIRRIVVGIDADHVYSDIGPPLEGAV